ncbi:MAG TPA: cellulose synthase family protein [Thermoanaerobaculia bacterium]|nr:cellulose synthase family protein [Thermoanaerobaculia bacterium]
MEIRDLILLAYYLTLGVLALYSLHRALLLRLERRHRAPLAPPADPAVWPRVTVQLPLYNELYVAPRLLEAACRLDYPSDRLEIQVLDDSDDETAAVMRRLCERYRRSGADVTYLHRAARSGYKAGALAAGLESASGEMIAVFDADFVPPPSFLYDSVRWFDDPTVGMVQARWEHLNRRQSLLTRVQAMLLDGHFLIEHTARHRSGRLWNFNGTAGVWRREAIDAAGGWQHDTLTEDLDLSYRAQLRGWRFVYLPRLEVPSELPASISALKSQQHRWAKGSIQTARKLLGDILRSPQPWWRKLEACVHLTANGCYFLLVLLALLIFPAMLARRAAEEQWKLLAIDLPLFLAATASIVAYYLESQRLESRGERRPAVLLPSVFALGIGLSLSNASAVLSGLVRRGGAFVRTPKPGAPGARAGRRARPRYVAARSPTVPLEAAFALYFLLAMLLAARFGMWLALPFLALFLHGYGWVTVLSWRERAGSPTSRTAE